jgi:TRAP-type mannitol/chloroaromatic compound transport system substrate-binding protein
MMKNIQKLKEEIKKINKTHRKEAERLMINPLEDNNWNDTIELETGIKTLQEVCKEIKKDIKYQKTKLKGDFEKDKPIAWRIIGFKNLLKLIEGN